MGAWLGQTVNLWRVAYDLSTWPPDWGIVTMRKMAGVILLSIAVGAASAAEIPQSILDADYSECMAECGASMDKAQCTNYCACVLQGVEERFDLDDYMAMTQAIDALQPGEPGSIAKLDGIVSLCAAESIE